MEKVIKRYEGDLGARALRPILKVIEDGGLVIYPTDSMCALACDSGRPEAMDRMRKIKDYAAHEGKLSLMCTDIKMMSAYTRPLSNEVFRLIKRNVPGPFTFILPANQKVPKLFNNKRKTIGLRISSHPLAMALVEALGRPLVTTSLPISEHHGYIQDIDELVDKWQNSVDLIVDYGSVPNQDTAVIDCTVDPIEVLREGVEEIRW